MSKSTNFQKLLFNTTIAIASTLPSLTFSQTSVANGYSLSPDQYHEYLSLKKKSLHHLSSGDTVPLQIKKNKVDKIHATKYKPSKHHYSKEHAYLAIIIDDIGNNQHLGRQAVHLPGAITYAVLPHTPNSVNLAELAFKNGKEVMLHAPMESLRNTRLGNGALTKDMSKQDFLNMLRSDIASIPHLRGINNHMGSLLTQEPDAMSWLMEEMTNSDLYFVDSRTTPASVASHLANNYRIKHVSRDVFLDNEQSWAYIDKAFKQAILIAKTTGAGVAIGHPYPSTINYLKDAIATLEQQNVELITVSKLIEQQTALPLQTSQSNTAKRPISQNKVVF